MPVPHGDDAPSIVPGRPNQHDETIAEPTGRDEARLAVIPSFVRQRNGATREDEIGVGEVQAAFSENRLALGFIPAIHQLMYIQNPKVKSR